MSTYTLSDGTSVSVDEPLDASLPIVVLLHGLGGTSLDMTDPVRAYPGLSFARNAAYPWYRDEGIHVTPPVLPVARFYADPSVLSLTSWRQALLAAGFSTVTYNQSGALIGANVTQLRLLATELLQGQPTLRGLRIAFVAHSRGGLIARSFLVAAAADPTLAAVLGRVAALVTLHSPHSGSGVASLAVAIDGLIARLQAALASIGVSPPAVLTALRGLVLDPARTELAVGSAVIGAIAAAEPVPGVAYHTFGGTSTAALRLWADAYTPDSFAPLPIPFPLFHWGSTPARVEAPLDITSFYPAAALVPVPVVTEIVAALTALAAATPELASGSGDVLVSDARAHLPFSATRTTNPLNHLEALSDPTLQAQVVAILSRLRSPLVSGRATTRITPFPASSQPTPHTVTANDAVSGAPITSGTVTVSDPDGRVAVTSSLGVPFSYGFVSRKVRRFTPLIGRWVVEVLPPTVLAALPPPYGTVEVRFR